MDQYLPTDYNTHVKGSTQDMLQHEVAINLDDDLEDTMAGVTINEDAENSMTVSNNCYNDLTTDQDDKPATLSSITVS